MTTKPKAFKVYCDPSHGWMRVSIDDLKRVGVQDKISLFSYLSVSGKSAYLEEDCDMVIFCKAYEATYAVKPSLIFKHTEKRSHIRNLPHYGFKVTGAANDSTVTE